MLASGGVPRAACPFSAASTLGRAVPHDILGTRSDGACCLRALATLRRVQHAAPCVAHSEHRSSAGGRGGEWRLERLRGGRGEGEGGRARESKRRREGGSERERERARGSVGEREGEGDASGAGEDSMGRARGHARGALPGAHGWTRGLTRPACARHSASLLCALRSAGLDALHRAARKGVRGMCALLRDAAPLQDKVAKVAGRRPDVFALGPQHVPVRPPWHPPPAALVPAPHFTLVFALALPLKFLSSCNVTPCRCRAKFGV